MRNQRHIAPYLAALLIVLGAAAGSASASVVGDCQRQFGSFSAAAPPPACWRPYSASSPFNQRIPSGARLASDSDAIVRNLQQSNWQFEGGRNRFFYQTPGSRPVYFSRNSDPVVTVHCTNYWGPGTCQGANGVVVDGIQIHIPEGAQSENQWDGHMTVIDQTTGTEYDFERASWNGPRDLTVWSGSEIPVEGSNATGVGGEADAANVGLLAGTIRAAELRAHAIDHALSVSVPCTEGHVWPAAGPWGEACGKIGQSSSGAPHMGTRLRLNMSADQIAASGAPLWEQVIMTAMAHYGMYITDTNGGADNNTIELTKEGDESFTSFGLDPQMSTLIRQLGGTYYPSGTGHWLLGGVPIDTASLRVIDPCVAKGTCPVAHVARRHARSYLAGHGHRCVRATHSRRHGRRHGKCRLRRRAHRHHHH